MGGLGELAGLHDCGQYDEECAGCRAAMWDYVDDIQQRQAMQRAAVGGRRVRS